MVAGMLGTLPESAPVIHDEVADKNRAQADAAARAQALIASAISRTDNAYLSSKGLHGMPALTLADALRCGGVSFAGGDLLIPLAGESVTAVNV